MSDYKKIFNFLKLDNIVDHISELIEAKIEIYKVELRIEAAKLGSLIITFVILSILIFIALILLSFTVANYLNDVLDSKYWGHAIVTGFYFLVFVLLVALNIYEKIRTRIEKMMFEEKEEPNTSNVKLDE